MRSFTYIGQPGYRDVDEDRKEFHEYRRPLELSLTFQPMNETHHGGRNREPSSGGSRTVPSDLKFSVMLLIIRDDTWGTLDKAAALSKSNARQV